MGEIQKKIYTSIFLWLVITAAAFGYVVPKFQKRLIDLQSSHETQLQEFNKLNAQVQSLNKLQVDLDEISKKEVKPSDLFTSDLKLVNEIKRVEEIARLTGNQIILSITGTADKAKATEKALSKVFEVPYTITLTGSFNNAVLFMKYLENAHFISPENGFSMNYNFEKGAVDSVILTSFYIHK